VAHQATQEALVLQTVNKRKKRALIYHSFHQEKKTKKNMSFGPSCSHTASPIGRLGGRKVHDLHVGETTWLRAGMRIHKCSAEQEGKKHKNLNRHYRRQGPKRRRLDNDSSEGEREGRKAPCASRYYKEAGTGWKVFGAAERDAIRILPGAHQRGRRGEGRTNGGRGYDPRLWELGWSKTEGWIACAEATGRNGTCRTTCGKKRGGEGFFHIPAALGKLGVERLFFFMVFSNSPY